MQKCRICSKVVIHHQQIAAGFLFYNTGVYALPVSHQFAQDFQIFLSDKDIQIAV